MLVKGERRNRMVQVDGYCRAVSEAGTRDQITGETNGVSRARRLLGALPGLGDDAVAIVNGLFGDTLDERASRLAIPMTIRMGDTVLPLHQEIPRRGLGAVMPNASPRICVLVHGLMSTEAIWGFPNESSTTYGTLLGQDHDMTVLSVRYNTGRHISSNGRELAQLLDVLVRAWPVRVSEINLIGHSMGGLVVRSACHYGESLRLFRRPFRIRRRWTPKVRRIVLIGVPNDGAGLEAFVNSTSAALWALPLPPSRWLGLGLDRRSAGIKDLRFGLIHDEDWLKQDPGSRHRIHPHLPHRLRRAEHLVIAGTVTADPEHPIARRIGDALVTSSSAAGRVEEGELFPGATFQLFPRLTHNTLAHHPDVYRAMTDWW
ncbi:MAG: alpha/beta hydrolase [Acidimicrobiales bacterium]|nr:alpha/beta hydrolase [Acidimicrobiales bacterium]